MGVILLLVDDVLGARVFTQAVEGEVEAGQAMTLVDRPHPEWSIAAANEIMHQRKGEGEAARALAACAALSSSWRQTLSRRVAIGGAESTAARLQGPESEE